MKPPHVDSQKTEKGSNSILTTTTKSNDISAESVKAAYHNYRNIGSNVKRQALVDSIVVLEKKIEQLDMNNSSHKSLVAEIKKKELTKSMDERPIISNSNNSIVNTSIHNYIIALARETLPPELNVSKHNKAYEKQESAIISQRNNDAMAGLRSMPDYKVAVEKYEQSQVKTQSASTPLTTPEDKKTLGETLKNLSAKMEKFVTGTTSVLEKTRQSFAAKEKSRKEQPKTNEQQK